MGKHAIPSSLISECRMGLYVSVDPISQFLLSFISPHCLSRAVWIALSKASSLKGLSK